MKTALRRITVFVSLLILTTTGCAPKQNAKAELRQLLREDPQLVLSVLEQENQSVLQILQMAEANKQIYAARKQMLRDIQHPFTAAMAPSRVHIGPFDASNTIVVYADFLCPYCKKSEAAVAHYIKQAGPEQVMVTHKFCGTTQTSYFLAMCYEALDMQADINPEFPHIFRKKIFENQSKLLRHPEVIDEIIQDMGVDIDRLNADMISPQVMNRIAQNCAEMLNAGFNATPAYVINGVRFAGYLDTVEMKEIASLPQKFASRGEKAVLPIVEILHPLAEDANAEIFPRQCDAE